ncbi:hypothetical protein BT96DRAFT_1060536 [Gymnopus androsaceus JB14]|uniref:Uncharacterized protein n=1 Tax=Gymnopus androsaceus JB14 TaxID=1447944 RepID=A0A6A4IAN4_9AGAR|nr:hypothetical protein BT96DRAFT_1060536 [Gymnopus androsaceus JB14]
MSYSLLTRFPDHSWHGLSEVHDIMHSPLPACLPIFPLNITPPQFDSDLWNKYDPDNFTMIPINYAECHKEIGFHCIWILSSMFHVYGTGGSAPLQEVVLYAQDHWVLLHNLALLNKEDARRALDWAEGAKESQDQLAQQLILQIQRHLKSQPVKITSNGSQSGKGINNESVNEHTSQNKAKPSLIMEKPTKSVEHILDVLPSEETLQVFLENVALFNKEDTRRALEWAEAAKESQDQLTQQLSIQIQRHLKPQGLIAWHL